MDVEFVILKSKTSIDRQKAGHISIVNENLEVIYDQRVKWDSNLLHSTPKWKELTGFNVNSFKNGKELNDVKEEVERILGNNIVVVCGGWQDFYSIGLSMSNFNAVDIQKFWFKTTPTNPQEPIGLRSLVYHYYKQCLGSLHTTSEDAVYTMKLYLDFYEKPSAGQGV